MVRLWLIKVSDHSNSVKGKASDTKVIQTESEPGRVSICKPTVPDLYIALSEIVSLVLCPLHMYIVAASWLFLDPIWFG